MGLVEWTLGIAPFASWGLGVRLYTHRRGDCPFVAYSVTLLTLIGLACLTVLIILRLLP